MNKLYFIAFPIVCCSCGNLKSQEKSKVIEDLTTNSTFFDRISLSKDSSLIAGSFDSVTFFKNKKVIFSIKNRDGYDSLPDMSKGIKNLSSSPFVLIASKDNTDLIGFFGFQYGCCPRQLTLLTVDNRGFSKIFDDEFDVKSLEIIEKDIFLFGRKSFGQCLTTIDPLEVNLCAYSPLLIYKIEKQVQLDSARTQAWNESNYVFRGFDYNQDIWVANPSWKSKRKIRPYVFKEKGAEPPK